MNAAIVLSDEERGALLEIALGGFGVVPIMLVESLLEKGLIERNVFIYKITYLGEEVLAR